MATPIEENMMRVMKALAELPREQAEAYDINGNKVKELTGLSPEDISDAVDMLEDMGFVDVIKYLGSAPYRFGIVHITPRGRYEYQRLTSASAQEAARPEQMTRPPVPIGSPYGFTDEDWEAVSLQKSTNDTLNVVMGFQFSSQYYNTDELKRNVETMLQEAITNYNKSRGAIPVQLKFKPLAAGYGEHLFNEIARDIIAADIAIFETSDQNPNVMLEMGVALTWGARVLPVKRQDRPKPPSDISGQTWVDYVDNASRFVDPEHSQKLLQMVERAARKKIRA